MMYALLALLVLGGGGALWYEKWGPGSKSAAALPPARQITLDSNLPDATKQAVIAAIMGSNATTITALTAQCVGFPWAMYELNYRLWELSGSQGTPPAEPTTASTVTPTPATPAAPATAPGQSLAQNAVNMAIAQSQPVSSSSNLPLNVKPPAPASPTGQPVPSSGPFDLSAAATEGAWQTNSAYIEAYQGALTFLAYKYQQPSWDPQGVDGNYGPDTQAAVQAFQTAKGLSPVDGKAGKGTATAIAAALTSTSTSGQGGYAAYPSEGAGPGDTRYGAARQGAKGLGEGIQGLGEGVQGMGEDEVQGMGEDEVQGLGVDNIQGLGEDEVQGALSPTARRVHAAAAKNKALVEKLPHAKQQHAGAVGAQPNLAAAAAAAAVHHAPVAHARPKGGWFIRARDTDKVWPRKVAEIGSGIARGSLGAIKHLADINPHLAPGGVMRQISAGDEVNIPPSWATPLRAKGFDVRSDEHLEGVMGLGGD